MTKHWLYPAALLVSGCQAVMYGTAQDLNKIAVGMTRAEVMGALGQPTSTAATGDVEFMIYKKMAAVATAWPRDYFVKIQNGRVVAYGEKGDFDSTKDPAMNVNINRSPTSAATQDPVTPSRLTSLEQLHKLWQTGAITQQEYEREKAKLLK